MWCRVLLVTIALTYVICVLLLSGLQKEDLDAGVLEKLQRRNVNIDDMNNESIREKCTTTSQGVTVKERRSLSKDIISTIRNSYEQTREILLQKPIMVDQSRRQVPEKINESNNRTPSIVLQNFINLYLEMMGKKSESETTTAVPTTAQPLVTLKDNVGDYSPNNLEYINHMLLSFIAAKLTSTTTVVPSTTTEVTTTPKLHIDIISQKIKELLEQTRNIEITTQLQTTTKASVKIETQFDNKSSHSLALKYIDEYVKLTDKMKNLNLDKKQLDNEMKKPEDIPKINNNMKIDSKHLSDDVINEITEKVRASVLKDLQTHMSAIVTHPTTAVPENTSTLKTTTESNYIRSNNNINTTDTSRLLEHLDELFQKLKLGKDSASDKTYSFSQKKGTKNEFHGPINVVYPPIIPFDYIVAKNETINPTPIIAYPFNQFSIINSPSVQKQASPIPIESPYKSNFESLSAFNLVLPGQNNQNSIPMKPLNVQTIQSEVGQIPPLMVKVPNTMSISQTIIVTTKRPYFDYGSYVDRNKHRGFTEPETGTNFYDLSRNNMRDKFLYRENRSERERKPLPRNRYGNYDEFYKDHVNNLNGHAGKHYHVARDSRDYGRFHELLERPEGYPDFKQDKGPKLNPRLKVSSRQQMALHNMKKQSRMEDDHFKNFLETQQKVNDMLEKLLATKGEPRSVEIS